MLLFFFISQMLKVVSDSIDKLKFSPATPASKKVAAAASLRLVKTPPSATATTSTPTTSPVVSPANQQVQQTVKKEILDAELELMTKQGASEEDTAALRAKLMSLNKQVCACVCMCCVDYYL
jgi:hypothetical protein